MKDAWRAEQRVEPALARRLIREQCALPAERIELIGEGWDNVVYRVDGAWVFRFPRRQIAAGLLDVERRLLPRIASHLPLPVPVPEFAGAPGAEYPWSFLGYRHLAGRPASHAELTDAARARLGARLGAFLAALHRRASALDIGGVPGDDIGRLDLARRVPQARERLARLAECGLVKTAKRWERLLDPPAPQARHVLVHGDLWSAQVLVDDVLCPTGVIDWGDAHRGDPAADLMVAYTLLPASCRGPFHRAYGPVDPDTWRLARFRALHHAATVALYADSIGDDVLRRECVAALDRVAQDG